MCIVYTADVDTTVLDDLSESAQDRSRCDDRRADANPLPGRRDGPRHRVDELEAAAGTEVGTDRRAVRERGPGGGDSARERDDRLVPQLREVRAKVGRDVSRLDGEHHVLLAGP